MEDNICPPGQDEDGLCAFCGSPNLWPVFSVESLSTNIAVLPTCLWQIVLSLVPLVWLLVALPFFISDIRKKKRNSLKWSISHGIKIVSGVAFLAAPIVQLILLFQEDKEPSPGQILSNVALALSGLMVVIMTELLRQHGAITSGTITIFWALATTAFWFYFTTVFAYSSNYELERVFYDLDVDYKDSQLADQTFIVYTVQSAIVTFNFILSWFPEQLPVEYDDGSYESPISWCNSMVYSWLTQLISIGYKKAKTGDKKGLTEDDVKNVKARDQTVNRFADFKVNWELELKRIAALNAKNASKKKKSNKVSSEKNEKDGDDDGLTPSLYRVLWATFSHEILVTAGWKLANDVLTFFSPQIIKQVLAFIDEEPNEDGLYATPVWLGYLYAVSLFLVSCGVTFVLQRYWYHASRVGTQIRCVLSAAIYQKALKVNFSNRGATVGEVVNYMSIDTQKFQDAMSFINMLWSAPLQIILSLVFLYNEIDWAAFMALGVFVLVAPLSTIVGGKIREYIGLMMKQKDSRIKIMNELLSGIKVLKLYAWEIPFMKKVNDIREKELGLIKMNALYQAVVIFVWEITPYLVQLVCFAVYMEIPGANLTAPVVYTSISLFNILRFPINMLPMVTIMIITLRVSSDRIVKFLFSDELDKTYVTRGPSTESNALQITKSSYDWKRDGNRALENFEMEVKRGTVCAVVGPVGCGKSAMISGLLGELHSQSGKISINGNVAYVSQQAWIQNMTLKDNILFGNELDEAKYQKVIDICCLQSDLDILEEGDQTEIGEKGINLSGGQKQRVAIARAVYAEADIYVFDDPLSAVDAHVGRAIFDHVLGRSGLLKDKTRLLVTHSTQYLPDCDDIVVMDNGGIILAHGNLAELKALKDERIEQIISVREKEKSATDAETGQPEKKATKKDAKSGNKADGKLVSKEKAEEGGVSGSIFVSYFRACGWHWVLFYIFWALIYQVADLMYNIWLSIWVDAIPFYNGTVTAIDVECNSAFGFNTSAYDDTKPECDCGYGVPGQNSFNKCYGNSFYLGIYGAIGVSVGIMSFTKSIAMLQGIIKSARTFHSSVLSGVMRSPMSFFDTTPSGRIVNRFGKDLDAIDMTIPQSVRQWISCVLRVIGTLVVLGRTNPWFLLVIPPMGILFFVVERYFIAANRQVKRLESTTRSPIYSSFGETISGASLIRAYKAEDRFITDNFGKVDFNLKFQYASLMCNRWLGMRLECFANLITFSVAIYAVVSRGGDAASAATMGLALTYAQSITQILNFLIRVTAELEVNLVAVERLTEYGELEPEADWRRGNRKAGTKWMDKGVVDFDKYSLRYREGLPLVLKNIVCQVRDGEKVGIVGRTGAGKSSLTVGMFRLVEPATGRIDIDKQHTDEMGLHDLREELTIIPQEPVLFSGTLRENLDPFGTFDDQQLWSAIKQSHLETTVREFEKKLEHDIAENGSNLSVGERQLVCLARALLRRSKVLIMDEATSAVDNNTDNLIQTTIRNEFAKMTVLTIAHRLNTIVDYDRVAVLDKGEIAEFDAPLQLYKQNGIFASMCKEANLSEDDIIESKKGNKLSNVLENTKDVPVQADVQKGVDNEAYEATDF